MHGMPAEWVTVNEGYGAGRALLRRLQGRGIGHLLAVVCDHHVTTTGRSGRGASTGSSSDRPPAHGTATPAAQAPRVNGSTTGDAAASTEPRPAITAASTSNSINACLHTDPRLEY